MYADNTTLSLSANWNNITSLTKALMHFQALLVTGKRLQHKLRVEIASLQLHLNATNINQILHHKLLSLIIDKDLSFEAYIDELCTRNCQNNLDF